MTTDSDRLAADGIPIELTDGTHYLRITMRGLKMLEDSFDGIANVERFLLGKTNRRYGPLMDLLAAGLAHEGTTAEALLDLAVPHRRDEYLEAVAAALNVAFPEPSDETEAGPKDPVPNGSIGEPSTTSPPSSSAAAMATSGT